MNTEGPLFYYYMFICGSFGSKISGFQFITLIFTNLLPNEGTKCVSLFIHLFIGNRLFYFRKKHML